MQPRRQRSRRQRRIARRVNIWVLAGYAFITLSAAFLKGWETANSLDPFGWLAKTNAIIWDTVTLAATLGALALGVREMVLAYFMRKEYEEDLDALLRHQEAQAEMVKAQAEASRQQYETVQAFLADAREQREADAARIEQEAVRVEREAALRREQAERDAALRREQAERDDAQIQQLTQTVQQLIEQNRQLMERLDRRNNGHGTGNAEPPD